MKKKKYVIKRSTTGLGLFALQNINPQTRILEYTGTRISNAEAAQEADNRYLMVLNETHTLDGKDRKNLARYLNHACQPNAAAYTTGQRVWIWSERVIKAGEEITIHYGPAYLAAYIQPGACRCRDCLPGDQAAPK
jgi:uncharacterized protein